GPVMRQNMFQEGLYHVFFKDTPSPHPQTQVTNNGELSNARIHRWFGTVVNTRLLVSGVRSYILVLAQSTSASSQIAGPVCFMLQYVAAGCMAMEVQRKLNNKQIIALMGVNVFSLVFGFSALLANGIRSVQAVTLTYQQRSGSYVARASSIVFTVHCFFASFYILFLSWRGLRRYSSPHFQVYSRVSQDLDETNGPLLEQVEFNL
uniref:Si:dkey-30c15.13 n=1 Tax=Amphilophus citrinellus TaxID=61819 RepID=A0A3Q0QQD1_AMPCI